MNYSVKWLEELGWSLLTVVGVFVLTALLDIQSVTDWKVWLQALALGSIRVGAAELLNGIRRAQGKSG